MTKTVYLKIKRQDHPQTKSYWQEFQIPFQKGQNISDLLYFISKNPLTAKKKKTTPIIWDHHCQAGICGSCGMIINGKARLACQTLAEELPHPLILEPLSQFKVIRDLLVDKSSLRNIDNQLQPWQYIELKDQSHSTKLSNSSSDKLNISMQNCVECGICLEVCPSHSYKHQFIGAYGIGKSFIELNHLDSELDLNQLIDQKGISDCNHAQNCEKYCPQNIPLTHIISKAKKEIQNRIWKKLFN